MSAERLRALAKRWFELRGVCRCNEVLSFEKDCEPITIEEAAIAAACGNELDALVDELALGDTGRLKTRVHHFDDLPTILRGEDEDAAGDTGRATPAALLSYVQHRMDCRALHYPNDFKPGYPSKRGLYMETGACSCGLVEAVAAVRAPSGEGRNVEALTLALEHAANALQEARVTISVGHPVRDYVVAVLTEIESLKSPQPLPAPPGSGDGPLTMERDESKQCGAKQAPDAWGLECTRHMSHIGHDPLHVAHGEDGRVIGTWTHNVQSEKSSAGAGAVPPPEEPN